ncbi:MAG: hypothetical protein ACOY0T_33130 [Myxococcota bacterium]
MRHRRKALQALALAAAALVAGPAFAGSYLNRAALLLHEGRKEADYLRQHFGDKELARMIHVLATTRVEAAKKMLVPKEVAQAHPHLLLVFEHYERAADAAQNGQAEHFLVELQKALDEERAFRFVLKQLGWEIPASNTSD